MDEIKKYDLVYRDKYYRSREAAQGLKYLATFCSNFKFKSVLDVGCGPGWSVIEFLARGYKAQGVESCEYLFGEELRVPAGLGIVKKGLITELPFPTGSFDAVFCTDVLEHISEPDVPQALSELARVSKKYIFMTICSRESICFPEMKLHCTVHPREWWEKELAKLHIQKKEYGEGQEYLYTKSAWSRIKEGLLNNLDHSKRR